MHIKTTSFNYELCNDAGNPLVSCESPVEVWDDEEDEYITSPHCRADAVAYFRDLGYDV